MHGVAVTPSQSLGGGGLLEMKNICLTFKGLGQRRGNERQHTAKLTVNGQRIERGSGSRSERPKGPVQEHDGPDTVK